MSLIQNKPLDNPTVDPTNKFSSLIQNRNLPSAPNNPIGTWRGTTESKNLDGLNQFTTDIQGLKAANQGWLDELGNSLAQAGSEIVLGAVEGVGYLGVGNIVDHLRGTEQDFGNSISNWASEVNQKVKEEIVPVYRSEQYGNWHEWMFDNLPSIASAISLMVPAMGSSRLIGATARTLGGNALMKAAGIMKGSQGRALLDATFDTFSMAATSRHMENMMESSETYNGIYQDAIAKGFSEDYAKKAAKSGAEETYEKNWNLLATDLVQYGLLLRTFKGASRATSGALKEAATKNVGRDLGLQMVTEGGEEGYQFVTSQESARTAKLKYGIDDEDYTRFGERMLNYLADPDFWTSVSMGALGGAVFEAAGPAINKGINKLTGTTPAIEQQRIIANDYETYLAGLAKDPVAFKKAKDNMIAEVILKGIMTGNADQTENFFKLIKENAPNDQRLTEEDRAELLQMADTSIADLKKYENQYNEFRKLNDDSNSKFLLLNRVNHDLAVRTSNVFANKGLEHLTEISKNNNFNALETQLIEQEVQLLLLEELQKSKKEDFSQEIFKQKIDNTKAKIKEYKDALMADGKYTEKQITDRLQAPDFSLYSVYKQAELGYSLVADEATKQFNEFNTPKGKEKLSKDIEKSRVKAKEAEFKAIMDTISTNSTLQDVQTARETANAIGKTAEFNKQFEETIKKQQASSPKFNPNNPVESLTARWKDNPLLKEYELNKITNLMLVNGGIPSDTILDEQTVGKIYSERNASNNAGFALALRSFFASNSSLTKIEKETVKQTPISPEQNKPLVDEKETKITFVEDVLAITGHSNLSNIQQYEFDRNTGEFKTDSEGKFIENNISISEKIKKTRGWEYLNAGKIPEGATIELEFDQNDAWNKQADQNNFLIELAYYDNNNRVVVGALPAYVESRSYESQEAKRELKALREQLWATVKASSPNQGVISLKASTKFVEYKAGGGRFHNIKGTANNPISVLLPGEELTLGVSMKTTQAGKVFVDFNGHPVQEVVMSKNDLKEGQVYMVIPDLNNAGYRVVKLRARRLKELPERLDTLTEYVKTIKDASEIEINNFILPSIRNVASLRNITYNNGTYTIELATDTVQATEEELRDVLGNLMAQVDVKKINTTENGVKYNEKLADDGVIVTDLHPTQPYHSTAFTFSKPVVKGQPKTTPVKEVSNLEAKKADIERRRQEDLNKSIEEITDTNDPFFEVGTWNLYGGEFQGKTKQEIVDKINAKYDAELEALKQPTKLSGVALPKVDGKNILGNAGKFKIVEEIDFEKLDEAEVTAWFQKNLPQIPVEIVPHLIEIKKNGGKAWGQFKNAAITLYRNAPQTTAFHEAFEAVFALFLSPEQQEAVLNEASQTYKDKDGNFLPRGKEIIMVPIDFTTESFQLDINSYTQKGDKFYKTEPINEIRTEWAEVEITQEEYNAAFERFKTESPDALFRPTDSPYDTNDILLKERLADEFGDYVINEGKGNKNFLYNIGQFFRKLWESLKAIFSDSITIDNLFFRINTGFYANQKVGKTDVNPRYKVSDDPVTAKKRAKMINYFFFETLDATRRQVLGETDLSTKDDLQAIEDIANYLSEKQNQEVTVKDVVLKLYENSISTITDMRDSLPDTDSRRQKLTTIINEFTENKANGELDLFGGYLGKAVRELAYYGIIIRDRVIVTQPNRFDQDEEFTTTDDNGLQQGVEVSNEEYHYHIHDETAIEKNPKDSLSYIVRKQLRRTEKWVYDKNFVNPDGTKGAFLQDERINDDLGFTSYVDFDEIENYLRYHLVDTYTIDDMMVKIAELKYNRPELHGILLRLEQDNRLRSSFFSVYAGTYLPSIQVAVESRESSSYEGTNSQTKVSVFNANRKNIRQLLIDSWNDNLKSNTNNEITKDGKIDIPSAKLAYEEFELVKKGITEKKNITPADAIKLEQVLAKFGIEIDAEVFLNEFQERKSYSKGKVTKVTPYQNLYNFLFGPNSLTTVLDAIVLGNNPYEGERTTTETKSALIAASITVRNMENYHQDNSLSIDGKVNYAYTLPTFFTKLLVNLKDDVARKEYLDHWWFGKLKWLQDIDGIPALRDRMELGLFNGLKGEGRKNGTKYFKLTDKDLFIADFNMYHYATNSDYAWHRFPTLADSSLAPLLKFKKYTKQEVVEALYQLALAEQERIAKVNMLGDSIDIKNLKTRGREYLFIDLFNDGSININNPAAAKEAIEGWMNENFLQEQERLKDLGILNQVGDFASTSNGSVAVDDFKFRDSNKKKQALEDFYYNRTLASASIIALTSVDLAFYDSNDKFLKRNNQSFKFTQMIDINAQYKDGTTPGSHYKVIYLKDIKGVSEQVSKTVEETLRANNYTEDEITSILSLYTKTNRTDGQGFVTLNEHKKREIGFGRWTDEHESAYQLAQQGKWDKSVNIFFQPRKPFVFTHEKLDQFVLPVQHKDSEAILLPAFVKGNKELKALLDFMVDNTIDSALFESAVKVGGYGFATIDNLKSAVPHTLSREHWGEQQPVPEHHLDTQNLFGSQIRKIILSGLDEKINVMGMNKEQVFNTTQKLLTDNLIEAFNNVDKRLGTIEKVQEILLQEIRDRQLGEAYENGVRIIEYNGEKRFNIPLFDPIHSRKMQNLLNAVIRKAVTKQKINGGSFVLTAEARTSNHLKIVRGKDGGIEHFEVMLPAWTKNLLRLENGEVDINAIPNDVLDLFGYRIPTEGLYSAKRLKVVGFTPDYMGGVILLPGEITTIAGEDFDIDKLYVMIPNTRKKYNWKQLRMDFNVQNDFLTWRKLNGYEKQSLKDVVNQIEDKIYDETVTVEEQEFYNKFQDFLTNSKENYYRGVEKIKYDLKSNTLTKRQRDNALMDIMKEIWSHPTSAARIVETGGFPTLTALARKMREKFGVDLNANPILPQNDYKFFNRTTNGNTLIGIAAVHNAFHGGVSQHTQLALNKAIKIGTTPQNAKESKSLSDIKEVASDRYIQKNLQEFIAAFVDNISEPVADDVNLNSYTINHAMLLTHNGRDLDTLVTFINQPVIRTLTKRYFNNGANFTAETDAIKKLLSQFKEALGEQQVPKAGVYKLIVSDSVIGKDLSDLNTTELREQAKILRTWVALKPYAASLSGVVKATRVDTAGTGQTMADNGYTLKQIVRTVENSLLTDVDSVLNIPLVSVSNNLLYRSQNEILGKYFPYNGQLFNAILDKAQILKGNDLTQAEVNFLFNNFTHFYASGFNFFDSKLKERQQSKQDFILNFPNRFDKIRKDPDFKQYLVMKHLRYIPASVENKLPRVQFSSNTTLSSEQRENLSLSLEAMLSSDNKKVQDIAKDLVMYAYFTTYFGYTYTGISHLVPTTYLENISDTNGVSYSNYIYKMLDEKDNWQYANIFLHQLLRHQREDNTLLRTLRPWTTDVTNVKRTKAGTVTSILFNNNKAQEKGLYYYDKNKELVVVRAFRAKSNDVTRVYAYAGRTTDGGFVYNILNNLGFEKHLLEFDINNKELESILPYNNIKTEEKDFFVVDPNFTEESLPNVDTEAPLPGEEDIYFSDEEPLYSLNDKKQYEKANEDLNQSLKNWLSSLGFTVEYHDSLLDKLGVDAKGAALIYQKVVLISQGKEDISTLPEETGHVAEAYSRGTTFHNRLMDIIQNDPIYKEVLEEYSEVYNNDETKLKQEAIGKLIGKAIIKRDSEVKQRSNNVVLQFIQGLWKQFTSLFKKANVNELQNEINAIVGNIASDILEGNTPSTKNVNIKLGDKFYSLDNADITPEKEALAKALDSIYKKLRFYKDRSLTSYTKAEQELYDKLKKEFDQKRYEEGIILYTDNAQIELKAITDRYKALNVNDLDLQDTADLKETIKTLRAAGNYVSGFYDTLNSMSKLDSIPDPIRAKVLTTKNVVEALQNDYIRKGKMLLEKVFKKYSTHPTLNVKAALDLLQEDLDFVNRAFNSLAEAKDPILKILDVLVKDALNTYQRKTINFTKQINDLQNRLQESGVPSNSFVYERDKFGFPTGNLVSKFNQANFEEAKAAFFNSIGEKPTDKVQTKAWSNKVRKWFEENQQPREDLSTYLKEKEEYFKETYGLRLGAEKYGKWLDDNRKVYISPDGETTITYRKELAQPSDKYLSLQYQDIYKKNSNGSYANQAMVDYYEFILDNLTKNDKGVPSMHKLNGRMPSIRKDFWERAAYVDKDGKKRLRTLRETARQSRETIAETFLAKEDEIEFGLIDENGDPVNYVPIFFTKSMYSVGRNEAKKKGLNGKEARDYARRYVSDNLSMDATSALIAYNNSINNFHAMSSVVDVAELTKDIIAKRSVFTGKINPVSIYNELLGIKSGEKGDKIVKEGVTSAAYERIDDYIKMVIFGQQKVNEQWLSGLNLNTAKTIDFLNTYTSLSSLAVNIYAGTANVLFGNAMIRLEGVAGEVINNKEILLGDKIYAESIPGLMADIGKRNSSSYLNLWIEQHNTMQDYNRELYDTDSGRSSRVARLMKMSSLYFINHAGEHYMQSKSSIALANRSKVMDKDGNVIPYWEAYESVNIGTAKTPTFALRLKEGLTKVGGSIEEFKSTEAADKFINKLKKDKKRYELIRKEDKLYVRYERSSDLYKFDEHNQPFTERDINRFINRQNWLNKRLHGIYNNVDKSTIQKYALGRMGMLFRKFIVPGLNRRFEKQEYNQEGEIWVEGYYRTFGRVSVNMIKNFIKNLKGDLNEANIVAGSRWSDLQDFEKANMLRTLTEATFMLATAVLASALTELADDDEDNWLIGFMAYEAHRIHSEFQFYINPQEGLRILKSPAAAVYQIEKAQRLLTFWDWFTKYETGKNKGLNRLEVGLIETMPFAKTYRNFRTPDEQLKFFSNNPAIMVGAVNKITD
jgi:hypothetical protein